jgi:translation elongation factor EF-Tu-like GTPase
MPRRLFVVEDAFFIEGRGLVPLPGIVPQGEERFRIGDPVVIKRPDGSCVEWTIGGFEIHSTPSRPGNDVPILLKSLNKDDVPIGSEVWSGGS